ncbi:Hypothetical protein DHA2_150964 [Giardia duodenalis]|uniref:Uncharacterized protein n=1 Tax=Giardia intestinalis TaxID=5741 RepID=V6TA07_GIAIN|nr:Hypothetical protein DHA2_150964 [Giardia intestinalis]
MTTSNSELQTLLMALLAKLNETPKSEPAAAPVSQPRSSKTRMKEVPITAREDPDIDPYEVLPPIDRTTHEYVFCRNGRWRAVPKQSPEQIKERTEKMLETKLRKRAEASKAMEAKLAQIRAERAVEESVSDPTPAEKKSKPKSTVVVESSEHSETAADEDPEVAKVVADHLAEKMRKDQMTRSQAAASSSVFGVTVTHK